MLQLERQQKILDYLKENRKATTNELSELLGVSTTTIRTDLNQMDKEKLLKKLKEIIPDKKRIVAHDIPEKYLSDTLGRLKGEAAALVFPQSTEEVSIILKYAH